jgi:uncharacterized membrane protein
MSRADLDSTDQRLDQALGQLLRAGVILAATVVLIGGAAYLATHWRDPVDYNTFHLEARWLREPLGIVREALGLDVAGVIQLGLLLLIATPVARVLFTVFAFFRQRDWTYVIITLIVLSLLLYSLISSS